MFKKEKKEQEDKHLLTTLKLEQIPPPLATVT